MLDNTGEPPNKRKRDSLDDLPPPKTIRNHTFKPTHNSPTRLQAKGSLNLDNAHRKHVDKLKEQLKVKERENARLKLELQAVNLERERMITDQIVAQVQQDIALLESEIQYQQLKTKLRELKLDIECQRARAQMARFQMATHSNVFCKVVEERVNLNENPPRSESWVFNKIFSLPWNWSIGICAFIQKKYPKKNTQA